MGVNTNNRSKCSSRQEDKPGGVYGKNGKRHCGTEEGEGRKFIRGKVMFHVKQWGGESQIGNCSTWNKAVLAPKDLNSNSTSLNRSQKPHPWVQKFSTGSPFSGPKGVLAIPA
jgi:hypothetical protein